MIDRGRRVALGTPGELKGSFPSQVLEVAVTPAMEAMRRAEAWPDVEEAALFGEALHITVPRGAADPDTWARRFREAGFAPRSVRPVQTTLEDVFVSLVAEEDRASGEGG
jgi:ABC-2 type transport system ATP-binding protein